MKTDPRFKKWCVWLNTIENDVSMVLFYRRIFSETKDIIEKNERLDLSHPFFSMFSITYMDSSVMGIRRQLKVDGESISFAGLLTEIAANPELVTRSDHYELYNQYTDRFPQHIIDDVRRRNFDKFASPNSPTISEDMVRNDLDVLKDTCRDAEDFADSRVAHFDRRKPPVDLNLAIISAALDILEELTERYHLLFFGNEIILTPGLPRLISEVFTQPWVELSSE